jgi:spore maturation protein CgeB
LNLVIKYSDRLNIEIYINKSRLTKLTDHIWLPKIIENKFKISSDLNKALRPPVFGREAYEIFGNSKIIFNAGVDMSGGEKGNMRCFESLGCGALLLSDYGAYPDGMVNGLTIKTYKNKIELKNFLDAIIGGEWQKYKEVSVRGHEMLKEIYSKEIQLEKFKDLI